MTSHLFDNKPRINKLPENPDDKSLGRFPQWLHRKLPPGNALFDTGNIIKKHKLNTVCEEAKCPNRLECYSKKTATFLALGSACTRSCGFCDIDFTKSPPPLEVDEPRRIAMSVKELGLKHVVITMVARDDLKDQGASQIAAIVRAIRKENAAISIELLTSDFMGNFESADIILNEYPEVFNHNIETVRSLTSRVRHKAGYDRTLSVLSYVKSQNKAKFIKSGIMVGLGETANEVKETIWDLEQAGCDIITIGQYLQPNHKKLLVKSFVTPEQFKLYEEYGYQVGVKHMHSGPFVRSSYNAGDIING